MNFRVRDQDRMICQYNLRGSCRFGVRCWNIHEKPNQTAREAPSCKGAQSVSSDLLTDLYGPSTSTVEEAISLVKLSEDEEKTCGICFDTILKKMPPNEQQFGILPNCNHCYCYACIRKWRQSKEFDFEVSKACPECRTASDFVYPSRIWMDTTEEKQSFIDAQKQRMKTLKCKYFRQGKGKCPFGNTCLYQHALPSGKLVNVGPPSTTRRRGAAEYLDLDVLIQLGDLLSTELNDFLEVEIPDRVGIEYHASDLPYILNPELFFDSDSD